MSNQLLASKIVTEEEAPALRSIPSVATAVMAFVGVTVKGPVNVATEITSFTQYIQIFGGYTSASNMTAAVEGFFENGGSTAYIVRIVHYVDITVATPSSAKATVSLSDAHPAVTLIVSGAYDGTYANGYKINIYAATDGVATDFNLDVIASDGTILETWPNLNMTPTDPRYVETIINDPNNGSNNISVADQSETHSPTRPVTALSAAMSGGNDGLASLADSDYVGSSSSATGLRALDVIGEVTVLLVPGVATSAVHNGMITYVESIRGGSMFAILDPPANQTAAEIITYVNSTAAIGGLTEYAAIYWPQIQVLNPDSTLYGTGANITVPPSGHIAGIYARNDGATQFGVWTTPAGTEEGKFFGVLGFETNTVLDEGVRDLVFPQRINPLTTMKGFPRFVDGARVLKGDGNFPTVGQRRGVIFTETSIKLGLQYARHKNNTPALRAGMYRAVYAFIKNQTDAGVFASTDPATAFFVDFGDALNPATTPNVVTGRYGLATVEPAEYVVLKVSQDTRALDSSSNT